MSALAFAISAIEAIARILEAGGEVAAIVASTQSALKAMQAENRDPSPAEWAALNAAIDAELARLNQG